MKVLILLILLGIIFQSTNCSPTSPQTNESQISDDFPTIISVDCFISDKDCVGPHCPCSYFFYDHINGAEHHCFGDTCPKNSTCHNKIGRAECECNDEFVDIRSVSEKTRLENGFKKDQYCLKEEDLKSINSTDFCLPIKCPNNSHCVNFIDHSKCLCDKGFLDLREHPEKIPFTTEELCVPIDYCLDFSCPDNTTCVKNIDHAECICNDGFVDIRNISVDIILATNLTFWQYCLREEDAPELVILNTTKLCNSCSKNADCYLMKNQTFCACKEGYLDIQEELYARSLIFGYVKGEECLKILNQSEIDSTFEDCKNNTKEDCSTMKCPKGYVDEQKMYYDLKVADSYVPGVNCSKIVNFCREFYCPKNSTCHNGVDRNHTKCECNKGFVDIRNISTEFRLENGFDEDQYCVKEGDLPKSLNITVNRCLDHKCPNNSTCYNRNDYAECVCDKGFVDIRNVPEKEKLEAGFKKDQYCIGEEDFHDT